jgi:hypothetical protein
MNVGILCQNFFSNFFSFLINGIDCFLKRKARVSIVFAQCSRSGEVARYSVSVSNLIYSYAEIASTPFSALGVTI